jgi:hypothetical protein
VIRTLIGVAALSALLAAPVSAGGGASEKRFGLLASSSHLSEAGPDPRDDPAGWLLLGVPPLSDFALLRPAWSDDLPAHERGTKSREERTGPLSYDLSRALSATIGYYHELLFPTAAGKDLRMRRFSLFTSQPERDVLDMHLFWRLPWSELNFGYQLQSDRAALAAQSYSLHRFVADTGFDYALTLGITRRFGGSD